MGASRPYYTYNFYNARESAPPFLALVRIRIVLDPPIRYGNAGNGGLVSPGSKHSLPQLSPRYHRRRLTGFGLIDFRP